MNSSSILQNNHKRVAACLEKLCQGQIDTLCFPECLPCQINIKIKMLTSLSLINPLLKDLLNLTTSNATFTRF